MSAAAKKRALRSLRTGASSARLGKERCANDAAALAILRLLTGGAEDESEKKGDDEEE